MMLAAAIPLLPGETPDSYCSRLAYRCGCESAAAFCRDFGVPFRAVITGADEGLELLARLGGADVEALRGASIVEGDGSYECAGQFISQNSFDRSRLKVCPRCLQDDLAAAPELGLAAAYRRLHWMLTSVRTCHIHGRELVDLLPKEDFLKLNYLAKHDFTRLLETAVEAGRLENVGSRRMIDTFECYLLQRVGVGVREDAYPWLDTMPFYAAERTCQLLGAVQRHGVRFQGATLTDEQWREAGQAGFDIAAFGEGEVRDFLTAVGSGADAGRKTTVRKMFGRLYTWLTFESEDVAFDPLRNLVRDVAKDSVALSPDDEIFGEPVGERSHHTVYSLSVATGICRERMRRLLTEGGFIRPEDIARTDAGTLIAADERLDALLAGLETSVNRDQAMRQLNVSRKQFDQLLAAGLVEALPREAGSLCPYSFPRDGLDALMERLLIDAKPEGGASKPTCDILAAARYSHYRVIDVVRLVLDRKLRTVVRRGGTWGVPSVLVDKQEVKELLDREREGRVAA